VNPIVESGILDVSACSFQGLNQTIAVRDWGDVDQAGQAITQLYGD